MILSAVPQQSGILKKKFIFGFKCVRFKFRSAPQIGELCKAERVKRTNKLSELLDCNKFTAREIISNNRNILTIDFETFIRNATFCKTHFKLSEVIELPAVLSLSSVLLYHRYFALNELGCCNVGAYQIIRFPQIMKMTPKMFKREISAINCNKSVDYITQFITKLDNYSDIQHDFLKMFSNNETLCSIKTAMNAEWLAVKFNSSLIKAHQALNRYPPLKTQSITITNQILDVLCQSLHFTISKVIEVPSILSLNPEVVQQVLIKSPKILDVDTSQLVNKCPLILKKSIPEIKKVEEILTNFDITDQQLLSCPRIITFNAETIQSRLQHLCSSENFSFLKPYKKFLWLVLCYSNLKPRLAALKAQDLPHSINMFLVTQSKFERYLSSNFCYSHVQDVCYFLSKLLNLRESEVLLKLKEFPSFYTISLSNAVKVVDFLLNAGISKKQLFIGLGVIRYKADIIKEYFEWLPECPECQPFSEWLDHDNVLHLLIYAIEIHGSRGKELRITESDVETENEMEMPFYA